MPAESELRETHIADCGTWGQPFSYSQLAHIVVPAQFFWELGGKGDYSCGFKPQPIAELSRRLTELGIPHRLTEQLVEIKLY